MHADGYAVLLPHNGVEFSHAKQLVAPTNDHLSSQLVSLSLRKTILMLVASRLSSNLDEVMAFFRETLYWYQTLERNPKMLIALESKSKEAIQWLIQYGLLQDENADLLVTPFGKGTALSGLLPATAVTISEMLKNHGPEFENSFEDWIDGLIYAVCASEEFSGIRPSRFLPWPTMRSYDSVTFWASKKLPVALDHADLKLAQCAQAVAMYVNGIAERKISYASKMSSGSIHRMAIDVAWVLDGVHKIASVPELGCPQTLGNKIAMLARRVCWGAPAETLDVMRVAARHNVPGFGRQRAMALVTQGIATLHDILSTARTKLTEILRSDRRAQALLEAASSTVGLGPSRLTASHIQVANNLGIEGLVQACNQELGVEYEKAIVGLLRVEASWIVKNLDDGIRQNVPDLHIQLGDLNLLVECKTCRKSPPLIKKEKAWAVLQKAADFDVTMRRVTLGKPAFDETSKKKCSASHDITLVEHSVFLEGLLRVHAGSLEPLEFLKWLSMPGVAEIERLGGVPTFSI